MAIEAAGRAVIRLREYQTLSGVPLTVDQAEALRRAFQDERLRIALSWSGSGYDLTAGAYVGTIALRDAAGGLLDIVIEPKAPIDNLFFMLTYAHRLVEFGANASPLLAGADIFDSVVDIFVRQVDDIARRGIHRGYIDREEDAAFLRGRLLVASQVRRGPVAVMFHQRTNEFTADLLENRILSAALWLLAQARFRDPNLGPRVRRALAAFGEASPVGITAAHCDRVVYSRLTERYRSPINLARLFLRHLSLEGQAGVTPFASFLVPMPHLFEQFVARLLAEELVAWPRLRLENQQPIALDTERRLKGRPDLLLYRDGRAALVLDTKYKVYNEKPTNADINQMFTYCHTLGIDRGVLLYPGDTASDAAGEEYNMTAGVKLLVRGLSLTGPLAAFRTRAHTFAHHLVAS